MEERRGRREGDVKGEMRMKEVGGARRKVEEEGGGGGG